MADKNLLGDSLFNDLMSVELKGDDLFNDIMGISEPATTPIVNTEDKLPIETTAQEAEPQIEPEIDERPEGVEPIYQKPYSVDIATGELTTKPVFEIEGINIYADTSNVFGDIENLSSELKKTNFDELGAQHKTETNNINKLDKELKDYDMSSGSIEEYNEMINQYNVAVNEHSANYEQRKMISSTLLSPQTVC